MLDVVVGLELLWVAQCLKEMSGNTKLTLCRESNRQGHKQQLL